MPTKVYSYSRFSTPEQAEGDSQTRQEGAIESFVRREQARGRDWELQPHRIDKGLSGFSAKNKTEGALGEFLAEVKAGLIEKGSILVVENVDRLSRQNPWDAQATFRDIVDNGVTIITLVPFVEYTRKALQTDHMLGMQLQILFMRANDESRMKSLRLRAAWETKRRVAAEAPGTGIHAFCPAWMEAVKVAPRSWRFTLIPERAAVIRRIYELAASGIGQHAIAQRLTDEGIPTWPRKGRPTSEYWQVSYVVKILQSPAVIGTYVPRTAEIDEHNNVTRKPLEPIPSYFPAAIDEKLYHKVQAMRSGSDRNPYRGKHAARPLKNIMAGLIVCGRCGGTMGRWDKTSNKDRDNGKSWNYLVCRRARAGTGCKYTAVPYQPVEDALIEAMPDILHDAPTGEEDSALMKQLDDVEAELSYLIDASDEAFHAIRRGEPGANAAFRSLEAQRAECQARIVELKERRQTYSNTLAAERHRELLDLCSQPELDPPAINAALRQSFEAIVIEPDSFQLACVFKPTGDFSRAVVYNWKALWGR